MKDGLENIDNRVRSIQENDDGTLVESHALWNNAVGRRDPNLGRVERDFPYGRTTYPQESRREGLIHRILRTLGLR